MLSLRDLWMHRAGSEECRKPELMGFLDTKSGVKGLLESGIANIPKMFVRPPQELSEELNHEPLPLRAPVIDLTGNRQRIVEEVRQAAKDWGFFQVVNHGVPSSVQTGILDGTRMFMDLDAAIKQELYSVENTKMVRFGSDADMNKGRAANWRDTLLIYVTDQLDPEELPAVCRNAVIQYVNHARKLGHLLFEVLSEALGLKPEHLAALGYSKECLLACHYYPACPEPELTLGTSKHKDFSYFTILLHNMIDGLQYSWNNRWVDIQPEPGSFLVNIGNLVQLVSNDEFKSREHRVVASKVGPRIGVACFFSGVDSPTKIYGPIKELTSEEKPPLYKETTVSDYVDSQLCKTCGVSGLDVFKLQG